MKVINGIFQRIIRRYGSSETDKITTPSLKAAQIWRERGVSIGENTRFYGNVSLGREGKDPITIGRNCVLTGCTVLGHDASTNMILGIDRSMIRPVFIDDDCFIGHQAIILMGVTVGKGSIVGAGAVVTEDVPPGVVVAGNPARIICKVDDLAARRRKLAQDHPEYFPELPAELSSK